MKRRSVRIWLLTVTLFLGVYAANALAQSFTLGDDPLLTTPEILVIVDTSGSMTTQITDVATGKTLCESNTDGSTCYNCSSSTICKKCINSSGSCVSVSGYSNSGNSDPITGRTLCESSSVCTKCINTSGTCATVTGYSDSGTPDPATGREICQKAAQFCSSVMISGSCSTTSGYSDLGKKDPSTGKELCLKTSAICTSVITPQNSTSGTCNNNVSGYTKGTIEATTGRYWCTKSGKKYLDCSPTYLDCTTNSTCLDCTACLDCSSSCYDINGTLLNVNATALTRQTAVRQALTGNYNSCGVGTCCANQRADGILDVYKDVIRFGFATYDDDRPYQGDICGSTTWNYPAWGNPDSITCSTTLHRGGQLGIKGRNQGTGSLIDLVDITNPSDLIGHNGVVQKDDAHSSGACYTTASGSTPLDAALWDARYYYQNWERETGYSDLMGGCRAKFVLLLTDGEDNGPSSYEYASAAQEAANLYSIGIPTFVIGFGNDVGAGSSQLNEIQQAGSGCPGSKGCISSAFLAQDPTALVNSLKTILDTVLAGQASRTPVVSSPSTTNSSKSYSYESWMQVTSSGLGWRGHLVQKPISGVDANGLPIADPDPATWTYFEKVLENQRAEDRKIYTVVSDPRSRTAPVGTAHPPTIDRPVSTDPLIGLYPFETGKDPAQLEPLMCLQNTEGVTNTVLMNRIRDYVRGVNGSSSRGSTLVNLGPYLGDIFHSSPLIVPPPSALTPNFRYELLFQRYKNRPSMIYVGANDGMLHAFLAEKTISNYPNATADVGTELWAFVPTNLLSNIQQTRWGHTTFVDGSPAVSDVLFQDVPAVDENGLSLPFKGVYRTVLITGERAGGSAYFALDVTDPPNPKYLWEYRTDLPMSADYTNSQFQCRDSKIQSWSTPVIGQVWLKNKDTTLDNGRAYQGRSVMIVPGGYLTAQALTQASSCIEFMEGLSSTSSIHVVDIETGRLLKKVKFSNAIDPNIQTLIIDPFYQKIALYNCYANPSSTNCQNWSLTKQSSTYGSGTGWYCNEKRTSVARQLPIPAELVAASNCTLTEDATKYEVKCCDTPPTCSTSNSCYYHYLKNKTVTGGITVELVTDTCTTMVPDANDRGHFTLKIESNFQTESVSATPVAQDTAFGQYITRLFVPTSAGKIYRIDLKLGEYDPTAPEGSQVSDYVDSTSGFTYTWDVGRSTIPPYDPEPWYDTTVDTGGVIRPIMVSPTVALDYQDRNLIVFFGSGVTDNLEYSDTWDYIWAVKEKCNFDLTEKRMKCDAHGTRMGSALKLSNKSERLFSKALVLEGKVFFGTYLPTSSACVPGIGYVYGKKYTDLTQDVITKITVDKAPPQGPTLVWTPQGPAVVVSKVGELIPLGSSAIMRASHLIYWGRVL